MAIGRQPSPICQAASDSGGIASGKCLVSTVPRPTHTAPNSAHATPGSFSTLASMPLPPISTAMPARETVSATARNGDRRSPRIGHARNATQTGIEMPSTAASLAFSHSNASPMNATQPPIVSIDTSNNRSHIGRGTLNFCRRANATSASAAAPAMPHRPREDNGGHSVSKCFMIGKLRPHPTDVTASRMSPSGDSRSARLIGGIGSLDLEPEVEVHVFSL
jgi:hypothetical protein